MKTKVSTPYYATNYHSPVGVMTLASNGKELVGLWNEGQKYHGAKIAELLVTRDDLPVFAQTRSWLDAYFKKEKPDIRELPLAPEGSDFRQAVWRILCAIPYGEVITYGKIAQEMAVQQGKTKMSSQAVGGAVGHNPISVIIPCHRVVGADGSLTGYAGGLQTKIALLELEDVDMTSLYVPTKGTAL